MSNIYNALQPYHKLRVFISSLCGDQVENDPKKKKYMFVRRELQLLLESTGLFEVYNYEMEHAFASGNRAGIHRSLVGYDMIVFLIDNQDGISDGVAIEEAAAVENNLKRYYFFCYERSKIPTAWEERIKSDSIGNPRCEDVDCFQKMAEQAYASILQDLVIQYRKPISAERHTSAGEDLEDTGLVTGNNQFPILKNALDITSSKRSEEVLGQLQSNVQSDQEVARESGLFTLDKRLYAAPKALGRYLEDSVLLANPQLDEFIKTWEAGERALGITDEQKSDKEILYESLIFLQSIVGRSAFDSDNFRQLTASVITRRNPALKEVLTERLQAIGSYYASDLEATVQHERQALKIASDIREIPPWYLNDIAIDLRNVLIDKDENDTSGGVFLNNQGQDFLNQATEPVYYPLIDRIDKGLEEKILERYEKIFLQSPTTVTLGESLDGIFERIGSAFWIALLNGSYTHIRMTIKRMIAVLRFNSNKYDDHSSVVSLIRLTFIHAQKMKDGIGDAMRTYHGNSDLLNADEARSIYQSIQWIPVRYMRENAENEFFAEFSCYCDDKMFREESDRVYSRMIGWAKNPDRCVMRLDNQFRFFRGLIDRDDWQRPINFACVLLKQLSLEENNGKGPANSLRNHLCLMLRRIDFEKVETPVIENLLNHLFEHLTQESFSANTHLSDVMIEIALAKKELRSDLASRLSIAPDAVRNRFELEVAVDDYRHGKKSDLFKYIRRYLDDSISSNDFAKKGVIISGTDSFEVIRNIIVTSEVELTGEQIGEIVDRALDLLSIPSQLVGLKISCCQVLAALFTLYKDENNKKEMDELRSVLLRKRVIYCNATTPDFPPDRLVQLNVAYWMMLIAGGYRDSTKLADSLWSGDLADEYAKIQVLKILTEALKTDKNNRLSKGVLGTIIDYTLLASSSRELDTKYQAVRCLIELTSYSTTREAAFRRLMFYMDSNQPLIRLAIVGRVRNVSSGLKKNRYVKAILKKAKIDNHYMVRKLATD